MDAEPESTLSQDRRSRVASLDGLRGVAALTVAVYHIALSQISFPVTGAAPPVPWTHVVAWIALPGPQAVLVFFVLSGVVLAKARHRVPPTPWLTYYRARLARLYLPTLGAVALAVVLAATTPRVSAPTLTPWMQWHADSLTVDEVVRAATLIRPTGWLDSPLWSLRWEVYFSLLLPVFLLAGRGLAKAKVPALIVLGIASAYLISLHGPDWFSDAAHYFPLFLAGVVIADSVHGGSRDRTLRVRSARAVIWLLAGGLLVLPVAVAARAPAHPLDGRIGLVAEYAGATLLVLLAGSAEPPPWVPLRTLLSWLGSRSFSLYLTHEPVVLSIALRVHGPVHVLALALPSCLLVAEVCYRVVERPTLNWVRWMQSPRVRADDASLPAIPTP